MNERREKQRQQNREARNKVEGDVVTIGRTLKEKLRVKKSEGAIAANPAS